MSDPTVNWGEHEIAFVELVSRGARVIAVLEGANGQTNFIVSQPTYQRTWSVAQCLALQILADPSAEENIRVMMDRIVEETGVLPSKWAK